MKRKQSMATWLGMVGVVCTSVGLAAQGSSISGMYVFPKGQQTPEQQQQDEWQCYNTAVEMTGYNPSTPSSPPPQSQGGQGKATAGGALKGAAGGAAMGAIAGDAGKGAAMGAAGGEFSMGALDPRGMAHGGNQPMDDARPIHRVHVDGFWIGATEVTNEQFARFVTATGYVTVAERKPTHEEFPSAPEENLVAGSVVFAPTPHAVPLHDHYQWWSYVPGANWRHPEGPDNDLMNREQHPVVHIAYEDAEAYAQWAGKRLPTEAEWEFAARGGLAGQTYTWGNELKPGDRWQANAYQDEFPVQSKDTGEDGFQGIAPVAQFRSNAYGLYDVAGNVWEWCSDWYRPDYYATLAAQGGVARNPQGPPSSFDPMEPSEKKRVHRGGSFLCTDQYCIRYMVGTRGKGEVRSASNHLGFRCVMTQPMWESRQGSRNAARSS